MQGVNHDRVEMTRRFFGGEKGVKRERDLLLPRPSTLLTTAAMGFWVEGGSGGGGGGRYLHVA